jgi:hypothetical protein
VKREVNVFLVAFSARFLSLAKKHRITMSHPQQLSFHEQPQPQQQQENGDSQVAAISTVIPTSLPVPVKYRTFYTSELDIDKASTVQGFKYTMIPDETSISGYRLVIGPERRYQNAIEQADMLRKSVTTPRFDLDTNSRNNNNNNSHSNSNSSNSTTTLSMLETELHASNLSVLTRAANKRHAPLQETLQQRPNTVNTFMI